ncbi:unnamed protein product [Adineta steineri]|uniref:Uncharacterized protein n=1 Tax=Adineta steineri TaxID=433720 RepID=A0A815NT47_9BILA|nr:unnamed protein product [Adineta steineri]CAF4083980.1 unnamed protein product [Adineta steineri]
MTLFQRLANKEFNNEDIKIIERICKLPKTSVEVAISQMFLYLPDLFRSCQEQFFAAFTDINHRAERDAYQIGPTRPRYTWPISFPTSKRIQFTLLSQFLFHSQDIILGQFINQWIEKELSNKLKTKCLILIGPANTGKTTFARSLSSFYNYYYGDEWDPETLNPYAHYTIYDNIPWDEFENIGYPHKKHLFLQAGRIHTITNCGKPAIVEVYQPATVLLKPENQGSLKDISCTIDQYDDDNDNNFWNQHACIYRMKDDESFYTP